MTFAKEYVLKAVGVLVEKMWDESVVNVLVCVLGELGFKWFC